MLEKLSKLSLYIFIYPMNHLNGFHTITPTHERFYNGLHIFTLGWSFFMKTCGCCFCSSDIIRKDYFHLGSSLDLHSDWGIHFTGPMFWWVCVVWPFLQHLNCTYHVWFSALLKHTNLIIKTQLNELKPSEHHGQEYYSWFFQILDLFPPGCKNLYLLK